MNKHQKSKMGIERKQNAITEKVNRVMNNCAGVLLVKKHNRTVIAAIRSFFEIDVNIFASFGSLQVHFLGLVGFRN